MFARLVRDESGQDLIEYGLLVGIIVVGSLLTITTLANIVGAYYTQIQAAGNQ